MEIVIIIFALVAGSIAFSSWENYSRPADPSHAINNYDDDENSCCVRKCLACGQEGEMKTWISNYITPKIIVITGFVLGYIPGLIFLLFYWGKFKCQNCGAIGKNSINAM